MRFDHGKSEDGGWKEGGGGGDDDDGRTECGTCEKGIGGMRFVWRRGGQEEGIGGEGATRKSVREELLSETGSGEIAEGKTIYVKGLSMTFFRCFCGFCRMRGKR